MAAGESWILFLRKKKELFSQGAHRKAGEKRPPAAGTAPREKTLSASLLYHGKKREVKTWENEETKR